MKLVIAMVIASALLAAGCGDDDDGGSDGTVADSGTADARAADAGCAKRWVVSKVGTAAVASANVETGALVLRSAMSSQNDLINVVSAMTLTGDFTVVIKYEGFVAGGTGAFSQTALADMTLTNGPIVTTGIGNSPTVGVSVNFQNTTGSAMIQPSTAIAGEFKLQRVGAMMTAAVTPTGGGTAATGAAATFGTTPVKFGVQMGSNNSTFNPESSIKYTDVIVTGGGAGGAAQNDDFSCDSLMR
jgi:hypothetical protein